MFRAKAGIASVDIFNDGGRTLILRQFRVIAMKGFSELNHKTWKTYGVNQTVKPNSDIKFNKNITYAASDCKIK